MRRWLITTTTVVGTPTDLEQRLIADAAALVEAVGPTGHDPAVDGSFLLHLPSSVVGLDATKRVRVRTGVARRSGRRLIVPIEWRAEPGTWVFPAFEGAIELERLAASRAQLTLAGSYRVPLGVVGAVVDSAVHVLAQRTVQHVLERVAGQLGAGVMPERGWRSRRPDALVVRDVMSTDPFTLHPDMPVKTAALMLYHLEVSGAPVVDDDGALVGVVSERDVLEKESVLRFGWGKEGGARHRRHHARTVRDLCTKPALVTHSDARLSEVAQELLDRGVSRLVVVDGGTVSGIVSCHDVLRALIRDDEELRLAVQAALQRLQAEHVHASVTWGIVALEGAIELRTRWAEVVTAVAGVDGVVDVDTESLRWSRDDVIPLHPSL
jgi:CBS domain-containing protein